MLRATLILILDVNLGNACKVPNGGRNVEQSSGLGVGSNFLYLNSAIQVKLKSCQGWPIISPTYLMDLPNYNLSFPYS